MFIDALAMLSVIKVLVQHSMKSSLPVAKFIPCLKTKKKKKNTLKINH